MTVRRRALAVLAVASVVGVAACATVLAPADRIGLENRTSTPVSVEVNGSWVGTYAAGDVVIVPITGHGGPPYSLAIRSPSGALLVEQTISAQSRQDVIAGTTRESLGYGVPCGWIQISYGVEVTPTSGLPPQDPTGPCP